MSRLFVFGCSFTNYEWPTWADLLGLEFEEYQNWGLPGIGNRAIAERLAECHARNNISKDDVVIVQWSSHTRHDWFKDVYNDEENMIDGWNIHSTSEVFIKNKHHTEALFSERAYVMHTLNMIVLAQSLLKSTNCTWFMTSLGDLRSLGYDTLFSKKGMSVSDQDTIKKLKKSSDWPIWTLYPEYKIYENIIFNEKWLPDMFQIVKSNKDKIWYFHKDNYWDFHPTPLLHNIWLNNILKPQLKIVYNHDDTRSIIVDRFEKLKSSKKFFLEEFFELSKIMCNKLRTEKNISLPDKTKIIGF
jgi:hypothetical protein